MQLTSAGVPLLLRSILMAIFLQACTSTPATKVVERSRATELLPFIRDGITTRREIFTRLGLPGSVYENGRIVIYWLTMDEQGNIAFTQKQDMPEDAMGGLATALGIHNLVVVFGADDVVQRHSLVFVR